MTPIASRLKDILWSIRRKHGMESDIDRIIPFLSFNWEFSEDMFAAYPAHIPEEFRSCLLAEIRRVVREYQQYRETKKGYHRLLKGGIHVLEAVLRHGPEGFQYIYDKNTGYRLSLKSRYQVKK